MFPKREHNKQTDSGNTIGSHIVSQWPNQRIITPPLQRVRVLRTKTPIEKTKIKQLPMKSLNEEAKEGRNVVE